MATSALDVAARQSREIANIPDYRVTIDGQDITGKVRPRLVSLSLSEKRGGDADQLDLVLDDSDGKLEIPNDGVVIALSLGWKQGRDVVAGLVSKGRFKVDEASHSGPPDQVTIRARSADLDADYRVRREKAWRDTTVGAVVTEIAGRNGLAAQVDARLAAIAVPVLDQHEESDMALVRRLGRDHDALATVKDRKLIFAPIGAGATAGGEAIPPLAIARRDGDRHDFRRIARGRYDGAEARWHDQDAGERKTEKSGDGRLKRVRKVYATQADAKAAAAAEARRVKRGAAEIDLNLAFGRADIYPDRPATLSGWKAEITANKWLVADVTHTLDPSGFRTKLKLETAA